MFNHREFKPGMIGALVSLLIVPLGDLQAEIRSDPPSLLAAEVVESPGAEDSPGALESAVGLGRIAEHYSRAALGWTPLHMTVTSGGASEVLVAPGSQVAYEVTGLLGDDANEGLALVGFDLDFDGGPLTQANNPTGIPMGGCDDAGNYPLSCCENPMIYFTKPWGTTNPAGYGGTVINGDLIQVGGAQNTIRNTPDFAPDPIGPVIIGVAQPSVCGPTILVTGGLVAPFEDGIYTLALENLLANVIREGEDGSGEFWVTVAAMRGTIQNLTVVVTYQGACCAPTGSCTVDDESGCLGAGGTFHGVATLCDADSDADGVMDACDRCPGTPAGSDVGDHGCDRPRAPRRVHDIR